MGNPAPLYTHLLRQNPAWRSFLSETDLKYVEKHLCFGPDAKTLEILQKTGAVCAVCLQAYEPRQKALFLEGCGHLLHWECFRSAFWVTQTCPFCERPVLAEVKAAVGRPVCFDQVRQALAVPRARSRRIRCSMRGLIPRGGDAGALSQS